MISLRDRWRRTAFQQFLDGLEPIDRATFWVAIGLGLSLGLSVSMIARAPERAGELPDIIDFAPAQAAA